MCMAASSTGRTVWSAGRSSITIWDAYNFQVGWAGGQAGGWAVGLAIGL
jgi:hypothetical protein